MSENGILRHYKKDRGAEFIPRELLQEPDTKWGSGSLSLEAVGLLCNLQSYPDNGDFKIFKTELHRRYAKNKRTQIDRIWDELVENRYILQFRKRDGKKYIYEYLFTLYKFDSEDFKAINQEYNNIGYEFYLKESTKDKIIERIKNGEAQVGDVDYQHLNRNVDTSRLFEMLNLDIPKSTAIRYIINEIKDDDEEYNIYKANAQKISDFVSQSSEPKTEIAEKINTDIQQDESNQDRQEDSDDISFDVEDKELVSLFKLFANYGVDYDTDVKLVNAISADKDDLFEPDLIAAQLEWCMSKSNADGIVNFYEYFMNGLHKRIESKAMKVTESSKEEFLMSAKERLLDNIFKDGKSKPNVPLYDWVRGKEVLRE